MDRAPRSTARRRAIATTAALALLAGAVGTVLVPRLGKRAERATGDVMNALASTVVANVPATCPSGMVQIDGGQFFMGSDNDLPLEKPAHHVVLSAYCMDVNEVTVAAYKACSDRGGCKRAPKNNEWPDISSKEQSAFDPLCNLRDPGALRDHPVNCVDWAMADAYCREAGARLPTEAEWEYAARGSDGRKYPWGDEEPGPTLLNACGKECVAWSQKSGIDVRAMFSADDGFAATAPVGSFPRGASPFGVKDMVGNVWEWVGDRFAPYGAAEQRDPRGPATETVDRVIRGGAWNGGYASWVRPTFRYHAPDTNRSYGIGFRCAKTLTR